MTIRLLLHEPCFSCDNADIEVNRFVGCFTLEHGYAHVHEISCTHECVCKKIDGMEYIDERLLYGQGEAY